MEEEIELKNLFKIFWDKKIEIILIIILFVLIGYMYTTYFVQPEYTSSSTIILANDNSSNTNVILTQNEITLNDKLVATYRELAKSDAVIEAVIKNLKIQNKYNKNSLKSKVEVTSVTNSQIMKVSVTDIDADMSARIANEVTEVFTEKVEDVYNIHNIKVLSNAEVPYRPSNISLKKNLVMFLGIGFMIAMTYVIIANAIDTTIKNKEDIENITDSNTLVEIPVYDFKKGKDKKREIITHLDAKSPISEVFRALRTNLQFMHKEKETQTILITSTVQSEGKSWMAANLATTFAQAGNRTLLIDADMRRARQHKIFEINNVPGLSNYLSSIDKYGSKRDLKAEECTVKTEIENLWILPSGNTPPNPSELLVSSKTEELIKEISENFDVVIFDGAPCLMVTDSCIISRIVSQTLLITSYKSTKKDDLKEAKKRIDNVSGHIVGVVLNKVQISVKKYNSKYYYYSNSSAKKDRKNENINNKQKVEQKNELSQVAEKKVEENKIVETAEQQNKEDIIENTNKELNTINEKSEPSEKIKEILEDIEKF